MNNKSTFRPAPVFGLVVAGALLATVIGCVGESGRSTVRVRSSPGYLQSDLIGDDDYVYYPSYEVYYSNRRHQYVYRDGDNWVTRPAPARVGVDVLHASPSVHLDFHDSPERHHANVVKSYPRNWRPDGHRNEDRKDDDRHERSERNEEHHDKRDDGDHANH